MGTEIPAGVLPCFREKKSHCLRAGRTEKYAGCALSKVDPSDFLSRGGF